MTKGKRKVCLAVGTLVCMILLGVAASPVFYLNDDVTMRQILSGAYTGTPDGHTVYMAYPLTGALSILYRLFSAIPWMELFFGGCILGAVVWILDGFWWESGRLAARLSVFLCGIFFCVILFLEAFLYMHYTVIAGILAGCGCFLWLRRRPKWAAVICFLLCFQVRKQVFWLSVPFLLAAVAWEWCLAERRDPLKKSALPLGLLAAGIALCTLIHGFCYRSPQWRDYLEYNDLRTDLYDYTDFLSTSRYDEPDPAWGLSPAKYQVLRNYDTILEPLESGLSQVYGHVAAAQENAVSGAGRIKACSRAYWNALRYDGGALKLLWLCAYSGLLLLVFLQRKWSRAAVSVLYGIGRSGIWLYLFWKGRFPERIATTLYEIEILLVLGMLLTLLPEAVRRLELRRALRVAVLSVVALLLFSGAVASVRSTAEKLDAQHGLEREWAALKSGLTEESGEGLYLLDVFSVAQFAGLQYERDFGQLMLAGGWLSASPLAAERLRAVGAEDGAEDGAEALLKENVFFVVRQDRDPSWLQEYLAERFGASLRLVRCREIALSETTYEVYRTE